MEHTKRHQCVWSAAHFFLGSWIRRKFAYEPVPADIPGPYLVLSNHNTDWDPLLVALSFKRQMYYVASEHIFRWGFLTKLIRWGLDPISRLKGATAGDTVLTVMRRLKKGANVCIFAEGNRSFDGVTGEILPSTGKLARSCGATLVTYRLEGGYLTSPRWSGDSVRRGKMHGQVVGIYPPETLRAMTPAEVYDIICRDLHEDAWERQRAERVRFLGKKRAEGLERFLCVCPKCGALETLSTENNRIFCSCGFEAEYGEDGFFSGEDLPFDNIRDWGLWQAERLAEMAESSPDLIFENGGMSLFELSDDHKSRLIAGGSVRLFADRLECPGMDFPLDKLTGIAIHGPQTIDIAAFGRHFELKRDGIFCAAKYITAIRALSDRNRQALA